MSNPWQIGYASVGWTCFWQDGHAVAVHACLCITSMPRENMCWQDGHVLAGWACVGKPGGLIVPTNSRRQIAATAISPAACLLSHSATARAVSTIRPGTHAHQECDEGSQQRALAAAVLQGRDCWRQPWIEQVSGRSTVQNTVPAPEKQSIKRTRTHTHTHTHAYI